MQAKPPAKKGKQVQARPPVKKGKQSKEESKLKNSKTKTTLTEVATPTKTPEGVFCTPATKRKTYYINCVAHIEEATPKKTPEKTPTKTPEKTPKEESTPNKTSGHWKERRTPTKASGHSDWWKRKPTSWKRCLAPQLDAEVVDILSEAVTESVDDVNELPKCFLALVERVARVYMERGTDDLHADRDSQIYASVQVKSTSLTSGHTSLTSERTCIIVRTHFIHIRTDNLSYPFPRSNCTCVMDTGKWRKSPRRSWQSCIASFKWAYIGSPPLKRLFNTGASC